MPERQAAAQGDHHPDDWLSRKEAAAYARRSVDTIDRAIKAGRLKATKTDGRVAIRRRWIDSYLLLALGFAMLILLALGALGLVCYLTGWGPAEHAMVWLHLCAKEG